jgi:hypothetical protein
MLKRKGTPHPNPPRNQGGKSQTKPNVFLKMSGRAFMFAGEEIRGLFKKTFGEVFLKYVTMVL